MLPSAGQHCADMMSLTLALDSAQGDLGIPCESPRELRSNCCLNKDAFLESERACRRRSSFRPYIEESDLTLQIVNARMRALGLTPMVDVEDYSRPRYSSRDHSRGSSLDDDVVFSDRGDSIAGPSRCGGSTGQTSLAANTAVESEPVKPAKTNFNGYVGVLDPENGLIDGIWRTTDPFESDRRSREAANDPPQGLQNVEWHPENQEYVPSRACRHKKRGRRSRSDSVRVSDDEGLKAYSYSRTCEWVFRKGPDEAGTEIGGTKQTMLTQQETWRSEAGFWCGDEDEFEDEHKAGTEDCFNVED